MGSVPNSYIDDLKSIVLATLNRIEQLRMRVVFGVDIVKGSYGQELQFKSDGKVYIDDVEIGSGGGLWEVDGTETQLITPDAIDMQNHNIIGANSLVATASTDLTFTVSTGQAFVFSKV